MDTTIGAPAASDVLPCQPNWRRASSKTLHGVDMGLPLKALELRAVVGEDNLVTFHTAAISR
jgi:hypothetical protein